MARSQKKDRLRSIFAGLVEGAASPADLVCGSFEVHFRFRAAPPDEAISAAWRQVGSALNYARILSAMSDIEDMQHAESAPNSMGAAAHQVLAGQVKHDG